MFVQFEEVDLITLAAACVTFEEPQPRIIAPNGKGIVLVIVEWTACAFLRVLAES